MFYLKKNLGFDGHVHLSTVETYSTITNQWTSIRHLTVSRCYCSATLLQGKIVVVGGYDGQSLLGSLEEYDELKDSWTTKTNMPTPRFVRRKRFAFDCDRVFKSTFQK